MGKYKPKRKLSAAEKKLFNLQKKSTITRGTSINSLDPDKLRDVGYTKKPESTIEKPPTLTGRVDQTKGSPAPKRTTFKPENQFNSYNPLDEEMRKNKKRKIGSMERRLYDREMNVRDNDMIRARRGEADKQNKLIDKYEKKHKSQKEKNIRKNVMKGLKSGEVIQDEFSAPTNSMGGGAIAGSVEAGDDPPVKKKKRYVYGGRGSRKRWMA